MQHFHSVIFQAATSTGLGVLRTTSHPREAVQALFYLASLPQLLESADPSCVPAQISRRPAYFSKLDAGLAQGVNWQVVLDGFARQEIPARAGAAIFGYDIHDRLNKFQEKIETTPGLNIDAALNALAADLQKIVDAGRP